MKWLVFDTEALALAAEAVISAGKQYPLVGQNAATGESSPDAQQTTRWAVPVQTMTGKWVFPSPDETGVSPDPDWWPEA